MASTGPTQVSSLFALLARLPQLQDSQHIAAAAFTVRLRVVISVRSFARSSEQRPTIPRGGECMRIYSPDYSSLVPPASPTISEREEDSSPRALVLGRAHQASGRTRARAWIRATAKMGKTRMQFWLRLGLRRVEGTVRSVPLSGPLPSTSVLAPFDSVVLAHT